MFGYVTTSWSTLEPEEQDRYKKVYCGLCQALGERCAQHCRLALTFDMTFLAMLLSSLYEPKEFEGHARCAVHPAHPHDYVGNEFIDYAADATVILAYHKMLDDWNDDKSLKGRLGAAAFQAQYDKACDRQPRLAKSTEDCMQAIHKVETSKSNDPELAASLFGRLMAEAFAPKDDIWAESLRHMGFGMGKFVYLMDAVMDYKEDRESGSYNPLVILRAEFGEADEGEIPEDEARDILAPYIAQAAHAFEKLPLEQDVHILRSVLYEGVWQKFNKEQQDCSSDSEIEESA